MIEREGAKHKPCPFKTTTGRGNELPRRDNNMTPEEIKAERHRMNLTINQMAELICVSPRAYAYYEAGQRKVPLPVEKLVNLIAKLDKKHGSIALEKTTD